MNLTMLILCTKRYLASFVDEIEDWKPEGAQTILYGTTHKAHEGFIFLAWGNPIPDRFHQKLREDEVVIDYFVFGAGNTDTTKRPPVTPPPQL